MSRINLMKLKHLLEISPILKHEINDEQHERA